MTLLIIYQARWILIVRYHAHRSRSISRDKLLRLLARIAGHGIDANSLESLDRLAKMARVCIPYVNLQDEIHYHSAIAITIRAESRLLLLPFHPRTRSRCIRRQTRHGRNMTGWRIVHACDLDIPARIEAIHRCLFRTDKHLIRDC